MSAQPTWRLAAGIHGAVESRNLVLLDVSADAYFCLPGMPEGLGTGASPVDVGRLPADLLKDLAEAGLVCETLGPPPAALQAVLVTADLHDAAPGALGARDWIALAAAFARLAPSFYRRPFASVLDHARRRRVKLGARADATHAAISVQAAKFNRMLPWSPIQGACLLQAAWMLEFLGQSGLTADWVFGVRTWPFSAHCWVQVGETVLNDTVERVAPYRVILRV